MKKLTVLAFVLTAVFALPTRGPATPPTPTDVEGKGLLGSLACGACIGLGVVTADLGLGRYYAAILSVGGDALARGCAVVCRF